MTNSTITATTVARVNETAILLMNGSEKMVPVKPLCEALGVSSNKQIEKIKSDAFLSSTATLRLSVGADGKDREMFCIPFKYIFGWLFTINPKNVKEESQETVMKYRVECYDVLYKHFANHTEFFEAKQKALEAQMDIVSEVQSAWITTKDKLKQEKLRLTKIQELSFDDWVLNNSQLEIEFQDK